MVKVSSNTKFNISVFCGCGFIFLFHCNNISYIDLKCLHQSQIGIAGSVVNSVGEESVKIVRKRISMEELINGEEKGGKQGMLNSNVNTGLCILSKHTSPALIPALNSK